MIASGHRPRHGDRTWFGSGRAALAFVLEQRVRPRRLHLPTLCCPSLLLMLAQRLPSLETAFYRVDRNLSPHYPATLEPDEALLAIHYFGYHASVPTDLGGTVIEDHSHALLAPPERRGDVVFASCRKLYPVADGGWLDGFHNPVYEPGAKLAAWLRLDARDWADLREAENMLDRHTGIDDISSQSLVVLHACDAGELAQRRRRNDASLRRLLDVGSPLRAHAEAECPLAHFRVFESRERRDTLRERLSARGIHTSLQWIVHPDVMRRGDIAADAVWWAERHLAFPIGPHLVDGDMQAIAEAVGAQA